MKYKAILDEKEYFFPRGIYQLNEEKLKTFSYETEDEVIVDLNKLKKELNYKDLNLISFQCASYVGEIVLDDEYALQ